MIEGLTNPLKTARVVNDLFEQCRNAGFEPSVSGDFEAFFELRRQLRDGEIVAPLFDPSVTTLSPQRALWMSLKGGDGKIMALQAFRADLAEPNLAEWALGWILGVYLKRDELIIPETILPADGSITRRISGLTVYHGELWIDPAYRKRQLMEPFSRLGVVLSHLKWRPEAIWALNSQEMARRGAMTRMGYATQERGFLKWEFLPDGADTSEWIAISDRNQLDHMISEMSVR